MQRLGVRGRPGAPESVSELSRARNPRVGMVGAHLGSNETLCAKWTEVVRRVRAGRYRTEHVVDFLQNKPNKAVLLTNDRVVYLNLKKRQVRWTARYGKVRGVGGVWVVVEVGWSWLVCDVVCSCGMLSGVWRFVHGLPALPPPLLPAPSLPPSLPPSLLPPLPPSLPPSHWYPQPYPHPSPPLQHLPSADVRPGFGAPLPRALPSPAHDHASQAYAGVPDAGAAELTARQAHAHDGGGGEWNKMRGLHHCSPSHEYSGILSPTVVFLIAVPSLSVSLIYATM